MFKVIIAGGRDFNDYDFLKSKCDLILKNKSHDEIEIVSGCANGVDSLAIRYAQEHNYKLTKFLADWNKFGKSAGYIRNTQMADYADALIAIWNGESKGTKHMIEIANARKILVRIIYY